MKVLAINSSPNMGKGNTALLLDPFLEGMKKAGAEIDLFYTKKLEIKPCQGEFHCWLKTSGTCFQRDDMQTLLPLLKDADVWVLATPLYVDGISGPLKLLLDRILPLGQPFIELRDGHCRHPFRDGGRTGKLVLVSSCGFFEMDNFDALLQHVQAICRNLDREFSGALLRPHGPALRAMQERGMSVNDIFEAAGDAGRQLVRNGVIPAKTLETIGRELMPLDMYMQTANQYFKRMMES